MSLSINYPQLLQHRKYIRNGMYPSTAFYAQAANSENHIVAFRKKEVFCRRMFLGDNTKSGSDARWRFRTGYGTTRLTAYVLFAHCAPSGLGSNDDPELDISVTIPGGATTDFVDMHTGVSGAATDAPNEWQIQRSECVVAANTTYEGLVTGLLGVRVAGLSIFEESDGFLDETVDYYNSLTPSAGMKIYDVHRSDLLPGLSNMWRRNGALQINWSLEGVISRTRTSATAINLIDNTETGTPTADSAGWTLDGAYRTTSSRAVIPCVVAVYGSMASGSGTFRLIDTSGNTLGSITINSATPQWWTTTANLVAAGTKLYAPQLAGDGTNLLSLSALSIYEDES
jgi:hypothetical protein